MSFLYKNNAISRLKYDAGVGDGTLTLLDGEGAKFPNPGAGDFFIVTIDDRRSGQVEICHCTARAGDVLTVTRAQEGTAAQAFVKDATVANRFTAGTLDIILSTSGYSKPEADAKFVDVTGDTMTGPLTLPAGTPPSANAAANKAYVDAQVGTRAPEAPSDGTAYGRKNAGWVAVVETATYTGTDILTKLKTVDGPSSGLDADLLDGHDSVYFATQAGLDTANNNISTNAGQIAANSSAITALQANKADLASPVFTGDPRAPTPAPGDADTSIATTAFVSGALSSKLDSSAYTPADVLAKLIGVDGSGSGLDADLLDGHDTAYFATQASQTAQDATIATKLGDAPNDGQQYVRKNQAWAPVSVPPGTIMSDAAPGSPANGQMWWETDTGRLFIWYTDANTAQWVQINAPTEEPAVVVEEAPVDGGEYVRVNGVWRLKSQRLDLNGVSFATGASVAIPTGAKLVKVQWDVGKVDATAYVPSVRFSLDGSTFLSGATDYVYVGNYMTHNATALVSVISTNASSFLLTVPHAQPGYSNKGDALFRVSRPDTSIPYGGYAQGNAIQSVYYQNFYQFYMNLTTTAGVLALKALSFGAHGYTGTFVPGSTANFEWVY